MIIIFVLNKTEQADVIMIDLVIISPLRADDCIYEFLQKFQSTV